MFVITNKSRYIVKKEYPSATIVSVYGGYAVFESYTDYLIWKRQK